MSLPDQVTEGSELSLKLKHVVCTHLLHYENLLDEFHKTVNFRRKTVNPGLVRPSDPFSFSSQVSPSMVGGGTEMPASGSSVTARPSQYPENLRSLLPNKAGEAQFLATTAWGALGVSH